MTTIADTSGHFDVFRDPSINAAGQVAFRAFLDCPGGEGLFIGSRRPDDAALRQLPLRHVLQLRDPILNASGTVAFHGRSNPRGGGIFTGSGGPVTPLHARRARTEDFGDPHLNASGQVVFFARLDNGVVGIFTGPDPVADRIADESGPFFGFGDGPRSTTPAWSPSAPVSGPPCSRAAGGSVPRQWRSGHDDCRLVGSFRGVPGAQHQHLAQIAFRADLDSGGEGLFGRPEFRE